MACTMFILFNDDDDRGGNVPFLGQKKIYSFFLGTAFKLSMPTNFVPAIFLRPTNH